MTITFVDLDVRPILRSGGEPFEKIIATVATLGPSTGLRLLATFQPTPLFHVLASKGFTHEARQIEGGDWEVLFRPGAGAAAAGSETLTSPDDDSEWPQPARHLDNRDLDPPEPMVRILAATETMRDGEVLSALLCRQPTLLLPELAKRGHRWRGGFEPDGKTFTILVRVGAQRGKAA
jgi:hypothetical protein